MAADQPTITLRPDPGSWQHRLTEHANRAPASHTAPSDRAIVGLPESGPVVMSGHQPTLWHAGILAKLIAACELARSSDAHAAWIVPDMDEADPTTARVPQGRAEQATARIVTILAGDPPRPGVPAGSLPPTDAAPSDPALPGLSAALTAFRDERSLAMQNARAVVRLACERLGLQEPIVISTADLLGTNAWKSMIDAIAADPAGCVRAYNHAAEANPDAGVRALIIDGNRFELPLWWIRPGLPRLAVFSDHLATIPADQLRPRALAMTAVVRAALCDLFIHGLGGERYDRVTEDWLDGWDAGPRWPALAPTAIVTADARADLGIDLDSLPDPIKARWKAHHARHQPGMLGDTNAQQEKDALLDRINRTKARDGDPAPAFAELQQLLRRVRDDHADQIAGLDTAADRAARLRAVRELAVDRAWPWPVLPDATLDALHDQIRRRLGTSTMNPCPEPSSPTA